MKCERQDAKDAKVGGEEENSLATDGAPMSTDEKHFILSSVGIGIIGG